MSNGRQILKIILSCNDNPDYRDYWPVVRWQWLYLGYDPHLFHVSKDSCFKDDPRVTVVLPSREDDLPDSQIARIYGCTHFPDEICVTTDMDCFLLQKDYLRDLWNQHNPDGEYMLAYTHGEWVNPKRCNMQYIGGMGSNWRKILDCDDTIPFPEFMKKFRVDELGWCADEVALGTMLYANMEIRTIYLQRYMEPKWHNRHHRRVADRIHRKYCELKYEEEKLLSGWYKDISSGEFSKWINRVAEIWDRVYDTPLPIGGKDAEVEGHSCCGESIRREPQQTSK